METPPGGSARDGVIATGHTPAFAPTRTVRVYPPIAPPRKRIIPIPLRSIPG